MLAAGFGFVECGTVTPLPQAGNPRPRLFRLTEERAVINRLGFNNRGQEAFAARLAARPRTGMVGANVGANKDSADRVADYVTGLKRLWGLCDYFTLNISSPNTAGPASASDENRVDRTLSDAVTGARSALAARGQAPIFLKVAPDLKPAEIADITATALRYGLDGLIVSNTTVERPSRTCARRSPRWIEPRGCRARLSWGHPPNCWRDFVPRGGRRAPDPDRGGRCAGRRGRLRQDPRRGERGAALFSPDFLRTWAGPRYPPGSGRPTPRRRLFWTHRRRGRAMTAAQAARRCPHRPGGGPLHRRRGLRGVAAIGSGRSQTHHSALAAFVGRHQGLSLLAYIAAFVLVVVACIPGPGVMSAAGGFMFGALIGGVAALISCIMGSAVVFLACRMAFGDWIARRAGPRLRRLEETLTQNAFALSADPAAGSPWMHIISP